MQQYATDERVARLLAEMETALKLGITDEARLPMHPSNPGRCVVTDRLFKIAKTTEIPQRK